MLFFTAYQACTTLALAAAGASFGIAAPLAYLAVMGLGYHAVQYHRGNWYGFICPYKLWRRRNVRNAIAAIWRTIEFFGLIWQVMRDNVECACRLLTLSLRSSQCSYSVLEDAGLLRPSYLGEIHYPLRIVQLDAARLCNHAQR